MGKKKRDVNGENTQTLVGFFTTPSEKALIEAVIPEDVSVSQFCREIILSRAKVLAGNQIREGKQAVLEQTLKAG